MMGTKKIIYSTLLLLVFLCTGCRSKPQMNGPLKIGVNVWPGYAYAFIAKEKGFFEKNKVDVRLMLGRSPAETREWYRNGEVDGYFEIWTDVITQNSEGIRSKVVYVADYSESGDVIIGKSTFSSLADLKGKTVGCDGVNTFSGLFILKALLSAGVKEGRVRFETVEPMDILTALKSGRIDAGHTWEPVTSQALKEGYKIFAKAGDFEGLITDVLVFNPKVVETRGDAIKSVLRSLLEARDFVHSHREEALKIMAETEGMSAEEMELGVGGVRQLDLKDNIEAMGSQDSAPLRQSGKMIVDFFIKRGQILESPNFDKIIEPRFVIELGNEKR